jgi:L-ascorbate metabolism protein UlaG (beta-lactamase superfamily)
MTCQGAKASVGLGAFVEMLTDSRSHAILRSMELYWLGAFCFRIRSREATIVTDPCPKSSGYAIGKVPSDIVTVSSEHPENTNLAAISGSPLVIFGPGEYESAQVLITGIATNGSDEGGKTIKNTSYVIETENLRICHLGRLTHVPTSGEVEETSGVDLLLVPVGGGGALSASQAQETIALLEPKLIIPMNYATPVATAKLDPIETFLKETGAPATELLPRLSVNSSSLPHEPQVVLLDYKR